MLEYVKLEQVQTVADLGGFQGFHGNSFENVGTQID